MVARHSESVIGGKSARFLNRAAPDLAPDPLVFLPDLLLRRMRRPLDADVAEIVEAYLDGAIAPA